MTNQNNAAPPSRQQQRKATSNSPRTHESHYGNDDGT